MFGHYSRVNQLADWLGPLNNVLLKYILEWFSKIEIGVGLGWSPGRLFGCKVMQIPASRVSCNSASKYAMSCNFGISIARHSELPRRRRKVCFKEKLLPLFDFSFRRLFRHRKKNERKLQSPCLSRAISIRLEVHSLTHRVVAKWIPILTTSRKRQSQAESWFRSFYMFSIFFLLPKTQSMFGESSCTCWDSLFERVP